MDLKPASNPDNKIAAKPVDRKNTVKDNNSKGKELLTSQKNVQTYYERIGDILGSDWWKG